MPDPSRVEVPPQSPAAGRGPVVVAYTTGDHRHPAVRLAAVRHGVATGDADRLESDRRIDVVVGGLEVLDTPGRIRPRLMRMNKWAPSLNVTDVPPRVERREAAPRSGSPWTRALCRRSAAVP